MLVVLLFLCTLAAASNLTNAKELDEYQFSFPFSQWNLNWPFLILPPLPIGKFEILEPRMGQNILIATDFKVFINIGPVPVLNFKVTYDGKIACSALPFIPVSKSFECTIRANERGVKYIVATGSTGSSQVKSEVFINVSASINLAIESLDSFAHLNPTNIW
jgi:hypothetical protein